MINYLFSFLSFLLSGAFFGRLLNIQGLNEFAEILVQQELFLTIIFSIFALAFINNASSSKKTSAVKTEGSGLSTVTVDKQDDNSKLISFISMLQEKGRLLDFIKDDIAVHSDEDVGRVARIVHQGVKEVFDSTVSISPVISGNEGETLQFNESVDYNRHKFLGTGTKQPPFAGIVIHKGWKATKISVPNTMIKSDESIIQAAEIEVK